MTDIDKLLSRTFRGWADLQEGKHLDHAHCLLSQCESPIEKRLAIGLLYMFTPWGEPKYDGAANALDFDLFPGSTEHDSRALAEIAMSKLDGGQGAITYLCAQQRLEEVGGFRCDFLLLGRFKNEHDNRVGIVIECDGHEFHERTKEQAARDRKRDRDIQAAGFRLLRFTGSEIHRRLDRCVDEVQDILERAWVESH